MRIPWVALLLALAGCAGQATPLREPLGLHGLGHEPGIHRLMVPVGDEFALGWIGVPETGTGDTLVVLAKGLAASATGWHPLMEELAHQGAISLAMEYRGPSDAWKVKTAVEDTLAATRHVQAAHPGITRTILYGMSMGGEVSGLVIAQAPPGTFTHWLTAAGVTDLRNQWHSTLSFRAIIEAEVGGTPLEKPEAYTVLSPLDQVHAIAAQGLRRVHVVHGVADTVVPVEQAERMAQALAEAGVPVSYTLVASEPKPWVCTPLVIACMESPLPAGPANHEAAASQAALDILWGIVHGEPDPDKPMERSVSVQSVVLA